MGVIDVILFVPRRLFGIFKTVFIFRSVRSSTKSLKNINSNLSGIGKDLRTSFNQLYKSGASGAIRGPGVSLKSFSFNSIPEVRDALKILKNNVPPAEPIARHYGDMMTNNNLGMLQAASNVSHIETFEREVGVREEGKNEVVSYDENSMIQSWGTNKDLLVPTEDGGVQKSNEGFLKALKMYSVYYPQISISEMKEYPIYEPLNSLCLEIIKSFKSSSEQLEAIWGIVGVMDYLISNSPESLTNLWEKADKLSAYKNKDFPSKLREGIQDVYKTLGGEIQDLGKGIKQIRNLIESAQRSNDDYLKALEKDYSNTRLEALYVSVENNITLLSDNFVKIRNAMYREVFWRLNSEVMSRIGNILLEVYKVDDKAYEKVKNIFKGLDNLQEQFEKEIGLRRKTRLKIGKSSNIQI